MGGGGHKGHFHKVLVESEYDLPEYLQSGSTPPNSRRTEAKTPESLTSGELPQEGEQTETANLKSENEADTEENIYELNIDTSDDHTCLTEESKARIQEAVGEEKLTSPSAREKHEPTTDLDIEDVFTEKIYDVHVINQAKSATVQSTNLAVPNIPADGSILDRERNFDAVVTDSKTVESTVLDDNCKEVETRIDNTDDEAALPNRGNIGYAVKCGIIDGSTEELFDFKAKAGKRKKDKAKASENAFEREIIESVREHFDKEESEKQETSSPQKKSSKGSRIANMFKFSKKKTSVETGTIETQNSIETVEESSIERDIKIIQEFNGKVGSNAPNDGQTSEVISEQVAKLKRLNSLDSGIVADKVSDKPKGEAVETVEYAVVQKKKIKQLSKDDDDKQGESTKNVDAKVHITDSESGNLTSPKHKRFEEPMYINGDKTDEDFVYINERAIDVDGLTDTDKENERDRSSVKPSPRDGSFSDEKETEKMDDERKSNLSTDSGTSSGSKPIIRSDITIKPEKANLKKKSWSFQIGGKKSKSVDEDEGRVANDIKSSPAKVKKSKWGFGKFSFRRSSDDVTASTPDLHKAGIPEEAEEVQLRETTEDKKKSKFKKLKTKKEKKSPHRKSSPLDKRSQSLLDIMLGDLSKESKRRSIVEDDLELPQTDAFEGVTLSDLSQDEDSEVSKDPNGKQEKNKSSNKVDDETSNLDNQAGEAHMVTLENSNTVDQLVEKALQPTTKVQLEKIPEVDSKQSELHEEHNNVNLHSTSAVKSNEVQENEVGEKKKVSSIKIVLPLRVSLSTNEEGTEDEYVNIGKDDMSKTCDDQCTSIMEDALYAKVIKPGTKSDHKKTESDKGMVKDDLEKSAAGVDDMKTENDNLDREGEDNMAEIETTDKDSREQTASAFSNMIYSDAEFQAAISENIQSDIRSLNVEDDSGAYVELHEIVKEQKEKKNDILEVNRDQDASKRNTESDEQSNELECSYVNTGSVNVPSSTAEIQEEEIELKTNLTQECAKTADEHSLEIRLTADDLNTKCNFDVKKEKASTVETEATTGNISRLNANTEKVISYSVETDSDNNVCSKTDYVSDIKETAPATKEVESSLQNVEEVDKNVKSLSTEVIIMKDVGVQAPDIYMPLDIEKDFGFSTSKVPCVSIGVQVDAKNFDYDHTVVGLDS